MVFVVAEIGVNWDGDFELAREMMSNSKEASCNAVKFQAFDEKIVHSHPEKSRLLKTSISESNIDEINDLAKSVGIEWFCTPMYQKAVSFLDPYVKKFKVRYGDSISLLQNKSTKLFDSVLQTKKEIIISVNTSPKHTKFYNYEQIKWLYVVPKYPCKFTDLDFRDLNEFDGYSNHCPHLIAPLTAAILGAKIVEVHITSDKSKNFVDNNVSFDYTELKKLVELIRLSEKIKK